MSAKHPSMAEGLAASFIAKGDPEGKPAAAKRAPRPKKAADPVLPPAKAAKRAPRAGKTAADPSAAPPWGAENERDGTELLSIRVPVALRVRLEFIAGTTFRETMTSIALRYLTEGVNELLAERGLPPYTPKETGRD